MRLPLSLCLSLLSLAGLTAAQLGQAQFTELSAANGGVIKLNNMLFDALTTPSRNWSALIQLTALGPQFKCAPCGEFDPSFRAVARAWSKVQPGDRNSHFFATLDFLEGQEVFKRLNLASAPNVLFFPATEGPRVPASGKKGEWAYDFNAHGFGAAALAEDLSRHTSVPIPYTPPVNYQVYISMFTSLVLLAITGRFAWIYMSALLMSRWLWAALVVGVSLVMTSGYMFVQIRGMPYTHGASIIAGGFQNQYGIETNIIAGLYGLLALSYVALILFVPRIPVAGRQRAAVYLWTSIMFTLFSVLLSIFRVKNGGYPFRLLL